MQARSAAFDKLWAQSHRTITRASVWAGETPLGMLPVISGQVTADRREAIRRKVSIGVAGAAFGYVPTSSTGILSPLTGNELRVQRGLIFPDGSQELISLGVFRLTNAKVDETANGLTIAIEGEDRATVIQGNTWIKTFSIIAGTAVEAAITAIIADRYPGCPVDFPATGAVTPMLVLGVDGDSSDPWASCQQLATDAGYQLFFDAAGVARMVATTDILAADPVYRYGADDLRVVLTAGREWDGKDTHNGVIVLAEGSGVPVPFRAEAWDMDPASPTYRYGPFGERPEVYRTSTITSQTACQAAADERLRRSLGGAGGLTWTQAVNPALEPGDVVRQVRPLLGVEDDFVIDSLTYPLSAKDSSTGIGRTKLLAAA